MKLINDIINELTDTEKSLSSPLLKTKVLASRLNNSLLLDWVSKELAGYENSEDIPEYRIYQANFIGTYRTYSLQYNDQSVPICGLNDEYQKLLASMDFSQSIESLENIKLSNKSGSIEIIFPAEITAIVQRNFRKLGNPGLNLIYCKKTISIAAIYEILAIVRNKLLDFMLTIDEEFGYITEIEVLKSKNNDLINIMNHTIINNSGNGNILNTGDNSIINATINISTGNKEELSNFFKSNGIGIEDSNELLDVIDLESFDPTKMTFGPKVNNWISKMLVKALDGTWAVTVGAAGTLLSDAIKLYYGH